MIQHRIQLITPGVRQSLSVRVLAGASLVVAVLFSQSVTAFQIEETSRTQSKKSASQSEIRIENSGVFQTFRIQREIHRQTTVPNKATLKVIAQETDQEIEFEALGNRFHFNGMDFIADMPTRQGGHQIVVEMKKGNGQSKNRAIGAFAPNSWIQSNNDIVHLFTNQPNLVYPKKYWIGVRCREVQESPGSSVMLLVDDVVPDSSAKKAGVRERDLIVRWNETTLTNIDSLVATIQANQNKPAVLGVVRDGAELELDVVPDVRVGTATDVRTIIASVSGQDKANQQIKELQKLVTLEKNGASQSVRLLLVGPGVNFGKEEIELQIDSQRLDSKSKLLNWVDRVAEKQFGVIIQDDSVMLKKEPHIHVGVEMMNFAPDEFWDSVAFGAKGHKIAFSSLAPQVIHQGPVRIEIEEKPNDPKIIEHSFRHLKPGQIVFPNPLMQFDLKIRKEIAKLKFENNQVRSENEDLKEQINKLQKQLKQQK